MTPCRFHPQSEASAYCQTCRAPFCRSCGVAGKTCPLCQRTPLAAIGVDGVPEAALQASRCASHPKAPNAKPCHDCGTPRCAQCLNWQGICPKCLPKYPATPPETTKKTPKRGTRRQQQKPDLSYTGGLNRHKGWRRRLTRFILGSLILAGLGWIVSFQYGVFKDFALQAGESRKKLKNVSGLTAGSGRSADLATMMQRMENGAVTEADVEATERLMARIQDGESVDTGQRETMDKLSKLTESGPAADAASDPQTRKLWAMLSEWSNEDVKPDSRPSRRAAPSRPNPAKAKAAPKTMQWKISLLAPSSGATVKGLVTVKAQIEGQGYIDRVEFLVNGEWQGLSNRPPFTFDWDTSGSANGAKTLEIVAFEPTGARHASRRLKVTVANP